MTKEKESKGPELGNNKAGREGTAGGPELACVAEALKTVEHTSTRDGLRCPWCDASKKFTRGGHRDGCIRAKALAALKKLKAGSSEPSDLEAAARFALSVLKANPIEMSARMAIEMLERALTGGAR